MMLRSSSTPILSSLLPSNESPNHHHLLDKASSLPSSFPHHLKVSFSSNLSPLSDSSPARDPSTIGFRRARSDGNLHSFVSSDHKNNPALDTVPSFSMYSSREYDEDDDAEEGEDQFDEEGKDLIGRGMSGGFSFVGRDQNLSFADKSIDESNPTAAFPLFLARGLGIDRLGSGLLNVSGGNDVGGGECGGGGDVRNGNGAERSDIEMHYRRMVEENPSSALFLSNYAQFLYQNKGDARRAEEYYSRAILADPGDGEILSQYAKLVWELHHDKERAASYFEQSVRAAPDESHVLAAYASFLWEMEDADGDREDESSRDLFGAQVQHDVLA